MTIITFPYLETRPRHPHVRRFDLRRDLLAVADLVEMCFSATLDSDGRRYIQNMRNTARHPKFLRWAAGLAEKASVPFNGFVWEQDGSIIGNLSLIPMHYAGEKIYLVANVAVHPEHRRKGIATALTESALENTRVQRAEHVWLHVRADNPGAQILYQRMGFQERFRRTTWRSTSGWGLSGLTSGATAGPRRSEHWRRQLAWLRRQHPEQIHWYLPLNWKMLEPGFSGWLYRFFNGSQLRHWSAFSGSELIGTLSWVRTLGASDRLWFAPEEGREAEALGALLPAVRQEVPLHKNLILEYPSGSAAEPLEKSGFQASNTLIWMKQV